MKIDYEFFECLGFLFTHTKIGKTIIKGMLFAILGTILYFILCVYYESSF